MKELSAKHDCSLDELKEKVEALQQASMKIGEKIYKGTTVLEALCGVPGGVDFATKRRGGAAKLKLSVLQSCSLNETSFNGVSYHVQNKGSESTIPLLCLFF